MRPLILIMAAALLGAPLSARPPSDPETGSPLHSQLGSFGVGRADAVIDGSRPLNVLIWYPAIVDRNARAERYQWMVRPAPPLQPKLVTFDAVAVIDAQAAAGRFPLVIVSHGFGGSPQHLS